jgi:diguanylate cyclase
MAPQAPTLEPPDPANGVAPTSNETVEAAARASIVTPAALFECLQSIAKAGVQSVALAIVDINGFHAVNRTHGFVVGDRFLAAVGQRLAAQLRADDLVTRIGGDEFALLLSDVLDSVSAVAIARQALAGLRDPFLLASGTHCASARAGVAICPGHGRDVRALLSAARAALHGARETGLDAAAAYDGQDASTQVVSAASAPGGSQDVLTGRELRDGLLRGEFKVHYQPIHNFNTRHVDTLEALVRWRHPTRGLLSPGSFLPAAERAGLSHVINVRVLDCACNSLRKWRAKGHGQMRVAVNLSAQDFRRDDFAGTVVSILERHALPPSSLELELTEHEQLDDDCAVEQVAELARRGIALTIDDFGVKYSSLRYLHRLPVRALKVDRSFVLDVGRSTASTSIVSAMVAIAGEMGLRLVAEGVEELRQVNTLRRLGCHIMQGYLFSPPVPADAVSDYLAQTAPLN